MSPAPRPTPVSPAKTRDSIRRELRARRRALPSWERRQRDAALTRQLVTAPLFLRSRHIALYLPNDGEVDLSGVIKRAHAMGKRLYLPVLSPAFHNKLWFAPYNKRTRLVRNCFRILEPDVRWQNTRPVWGIDLVLLPLVGFDRAANRLGMGGGFYDRTLAFMSRRSRWRKPSLLGVAYAFQEYDRLPVESWDVPLSAMVTDQGFVGC